MKKIFLSISILYLIIFSSCIIERPLPVIAPLKSTEENKAFYFDKENKFVFVLECWRSFDDSDYVQLFVTLENFSNQVIICEFQNINIYDAEYLFKPRENNPIYRGEWRKDLDKVFEKQIIFKPNEGITYFIKYFPSVKDKSYDKLISKNDSDILVTNIILEINKLQINIPEFYFKD
jgi:hypothetical protein